MKSGQPRKGRLRVSGFAQPLGDLDEEVVNHDRVISIPWYALQGRNAYRNMLSNCYGRRMDKTPDEKRDILRRFIADNGLKIGGKLPYVPPAWLERRPFGLPFLHIHAPRLTGLAMKPPVIVTLAPCQ